MIKDTTEIKPRPTEDLVWDGDAIKAQGFAYMAVGRLKGLPSTFPQTIGVSASTIGGQIVMPENQEERSVA